MEYHKSLNTLPIFCFYSILKDIEKNIGLMLINYDLIPESEKEAKIELVKAELLTTFTELQKEYSALSFSKKELQMGKDSMELTYLLGKKQILESALFVYTNTHDHHALFVLNEFKDVNVPLPITDKSIDYIGIKIKHLQNKINIKGIAYKNKYAIDHEEAVEETENEVIRNLDKQALNLEMGLELGYNIDPKKTSVIRWMNLMERATEKAKEINKISKK